VSSDRWNRLSDWHNAWLAADASGRQRLRADLSVSSPELSAEADKLVATAESVTGFLETPAFVITAARMAVDDAGLAPGTLVGPYRINSLIARGGMGIVYRATDTRLDREIALKMVLTVGAPDGLAAERFLREARITASLDHPNVVKVFDVGMQDGHPFMVVELLDGETLRQMLDRGQASEAETRRIGIEIARGLIAASAAGLVHRDLKPENIFLTRAGVTKVLDFGIAKLAPDGARRRSGASTLTGILLGTAGYLAPEQIQGGEADGRSDLFALGSILFEMLTGQRAFACENTVDTLHAIIHDPAPDIATYREGVSTSLATIVARLLQKSPSNRFQTAADLVWALEQDLSPSERVRVAPAADSQSKPRSHSSTGSWRWAAAIAVPLLLVGAWWTGSLSRDVPTPDLQRFEWAMPAGTGMYSAPAVSPDGRRIAWIGARNDGPAQIFVRELSADAVPLAGTNGARQPFWSPDSKWIGFFARGKLVKIAATGGPVTAITDAPDAKGGAWSPNGVILFQPTYRDEPLMRVSDQGGAAEPATVLDAAQDDASHRWPAFLPDGRHFIYFVYSGRDDRRGVYVGTLDGPPTAAGARLFASDSGAIYTPGSSASQGLLLSTGSGGVEVRSFDTDRLVVSGDTRSIAVSAAAATPHHPSLLSASGDVLAFGSSTIPYGFRFGRIDRDGSNLTLEEGNQLGGFPRVSPDGRFLARCRVDQIRSNPDIWVDDLERGTTIRLTTSSEHDVMPVWSPDSREIAYRSGTLDKPTIAIAAADGSGVKRTLVCPESPCEPNDWSRDGFLILTVRGGDLWKLPLTPGVGPHKLLAEKATERDARISPDGKWFAYVSDETERAEISVRSLTGPARRAVVTSGGGDQPVWSHDGKELFFVGPEGRVFVTAVEPGPRDTLTFGAATKLEVPPLGARHWGTVYDVSHDGRVVYFPGQPADTPPTNIGVVMGWRQLIK
jgi:serine/threonine protein kinase/Tol biopolymer transport system component